LGRTVCQKRRNRPAQVRSLGAWPASLLGLLGVLAAPASHADLNPLLIGSLPPGKTITIRFDADIATPPTLPAGVTSVSNQGSISATGIPVLLTDDPDAGGTADPTVTALDRSLDLRVTKTESVDPVFAGSAPGNLTYVVTVENVGGNDASGVALSETLTLPAGVTIDSITPSAGLYAPANAPVGSWTLGNLPVGASETLTVVLSVSGATLPGIDAISDTATITAADGVLTNTGDDSASESTSVTDAIDLVVSMGESIDPVTAGSGPGNLSYLVTLSNTAPVAASGIQLSEVLALPAGVSVDSITPSTGSYAPPNSANGTWSVPVLAPNASATLTLILTAAASTAAGTDVIASTAAVTAANEPLANPANDTAAESTSVQRVADLRISKTDNTDSLPAGASTTYSILVENLGPSDVTGATVTDLLPAGVASASWTCAAGPGASCSPGPNSGNINDSVDLAAGASLTYSLTVQLDPLFAGPLQNTAQVTPPADTSDPTPANSSATDLTQVAAAPVIPVPTLTLFGLSLLSGLLGLIGWRRRRAT